MFRRWKCFVGGNVSSVEMFRRWKCFVGGNVSSVEMFRHLAKFSSLSTDEITWFPAAEIEVQMHNK